MIKDNANCISNLPFPNPSLDLAFKKLLIYFINFFFLVKENENCIANLCFPCSIKDFFNANLNFLFV
jgi:hypothetical protein